jgi:hypothetical protein
MGPCNYLTVIVLKIYKEAAVISALLKVYSIPCHDRSYISVMLVLQSCTDSLQVLSGSSSESFPASSDGACNFSSTEVEEDVVAIEEGFIALNGEAAVRIKQEEIPEDITFPDIKPEPDEVNYMCMSVIRQILPLSRNAICFYDVSISGQLKQIRSWEETCFLLCLIYFWE